MGEVLGIVAGQLPSEAFAPVAGVHRGNLYASLGDGSLYRLSQSGTEWALAG